MANILVVDDDPDLRPLMKLALSKLGHTPTLAARGEEGLTAALNGQFDVVILDLMMPDMDGYEVTRRLRADPHTLTLPVLILSARSQQADQDMAMKAGANDYIVKPFNAEELNAKILALIKMRQTQPVTPATNTSLARVWPVLGLRGGVGGTTLSINLAGILTRSNKRVCLIDMSTVGGHISLHLRLRPNATWMDLPAHLSAATLSPALTAHESGLTVLAAPNLPVRHTWNKDSFQAVLNQVRAIYTDVVIDMSPLLDDTAALALAAASAVLLVCAPEVTSIHTIMGALRILPNLGVSADHLKVILNHPTVEAGLVPGAVEKALGRAPEAILPYDRAQAGALAHGAPLIFSQPSAPLITALGPFALKLASGSRFIA